MTAADAARGRFRVSAALWAVATGVGMLLTHAWRHSAIVRWDASVDATVARHRTGWLNTLSHATTYGAETITVVLIALVMLGLLRWRLGRWREAAFLATTVAGEVLIFVSVTMIVNRDRPAVPRLDDAPPTSSFPSGHTAAAVALYGALAVIAVHSSTRRWLRVAAVALAVLMPVAVALARLYRGMHFPTDVLAATLIAALWLSATGALILRGGAATRKRPPGRPEPRGQPA